MQYKRLLDQLRLDEGYKPAPYKDSLGVWTIGYGSTYIGVDRVTATTSWISNQTALSMLMGGAFSACIDAQGIFDNFDELDDVRQEVLVNMAYNLGGIGLARFVKMNAAIQSNDFDLAAAEMKNSNWYNQVGDRAKRLVNRMITGNHYSTNTME